MPAESPADDEEAEDSAYDKHTKTRRHEKVDKNVEWKNSDHVLSADESLDEAMPHQDLAFLSDDDSDGSDDLANLELDEASKEWAEGN